MIRQEDVKQMEEAWENEERWKGITRPYSAEDVLKLRGSIKVEYTLADMGANRLWNLMQEDPFVRALGALTGNQASWTGPEMKFIPPWRQER